MKILLQILWDLISLVSVGVIGYTLYYTFFVEPKKVETKKESYEEWDY